MCNKILATIEYGNLRSSWVRNRCWAPNVMSRNVGRQMLCPGFAQSAEHEGTVMDNGYHTELHTYSERERKSSQVIHCSLA